MTRQWDPVVGHEAYRRAMLRRRVGVILGLALVGTAWGCGDQELTADQERAFREVTAYWTNADATVTRSDEYQKAAAVQFRRNLDVLADADLGEEAAAAIRTLSSCAHRVTDGSEQTDANDCANAFVTVRAAADQRRQ
jgi:hypothetical protein